MFYAVFAVFQSFIGGDYLLNVLIPSENHFPRKKHMKLYQSPLTHETVKDSTQMQTAVQYKRITDEHFLDKQMRERERERERDKSKIYFHDKINLNIR